MGVIEGSEEVVSQGADMSQTVKDDIHIVISLDVVQPHNTWNRNGSMGCGSETEGGGGTWEVFSSIQSNRELGGGVQSSHMVWGEGWTEHILEREKERGRARAGREGRREEGREGGSESGRKGEWEREGEGRRGRTEIR